MTIVDPAFTGVGQTPGTKIWRIENFAAVPYPEKDYGKFYSGDSYIILYTKERNGVLSWDIHFWLGKETTQDEKGTAAIKAVELDEMLGGIPVQHRETEEYESPLFLSYFPGGVRYVPGGVKSGFKHFNPDEAPSRLFQVKGKRNVRVREVETSVKSMNKGDCFVLDTPKKLYVYVGRYSKRTERLKAIQAANQIRDQDHGGRLKITVIEPSSSEEEVADFFSALGGGSRAEMADPPPTDDDMAFEKQAESTVSLFHVSDSSGELKVEKVGEKPLKRQMLQSQEGDGGEDCYILDAGKSGIFVWIGRKCTREEKGHAMKSAEGFLAHNNYPQWTRIQRVVDGGEPPAFKQYFTVWKEADDSPPIIGKVYTMEKIAASTPVLGVKIRDAGSDKEKLRKLLKNLGKALGFCPDDGTGKTELWRIENFELAPVPSEKHGMFFGGDSYVLKYTYKEKSGRENYILYFWQGVDSSQDEKAAAALQTMRLDDQLGGRAVQVRVLQGHEPAHFLRVFKGKMIVFRGGHASGFKNVREHDTYDSNAPRLFQVQGTCDEDTRAVEVIPQAGSLDSDDVFVLDGPSVTYMWIGKGASEEEKAMGMNVDALVSPDRTAIKIGEGSEPEEFWALLGGKGEYNKDLNEDDVMVLDTGADEIFIWLGKGASAEERANSLKMSDEYIRSQHERAGGNAVTISIVVKQNEEPESFRVLFPDWQ